MIFLSIFSFCFVLLIVYAFINKVNGFNPYLFLACTVGVLIVPTISNDYKLPLLIAPVSVLFSNWPNMEVTFKKFISVIMLLIVSIAFWSTLYPFKFKPEIFHNSMPILMLILLPTTFIILISKRNKDNHFIDL